MKHKRYLKEAAEGAALGLLAAGILIGAVKINAAGADTDLPEEYRKYCEEIGTCVKPKGNKNFRYYVFRAKLDNFLGKV